LNYTRIAREPANFYRRFRQVSSNL